MIIDTFLNDSKAYAAASKKEGKVWGKVFSNDKRNQAVKKDQLAAASLGLNRDLPGLPGLLKKHGLNPKTGLSLACGGGRAEREYLRLGICERFHGIDMATGALKEARDIAKSENLNISYENADLNSLNLTSNHYDLVIAQNCLHHIVRLEDLADQIQRCLKPDGVIWISDYIGETQFQYDEERLQLVNRIKALLPERFHQDLVNNRTVNKLVRREPGTLISPFEAIRSEEIMPIFLERFEILEGHEKDAFLDLVCPSGTRQNYLENEDTKALFELLYLFDRLLIEKEVFMPRGGSFLLRTKQEVTQ